MKVEEYVRQILQARSREERRSRRLARVPFHLRDKVKARVEWEWRRARKR